MSRSTTTKNSARRGRKPGPAETDLEEAVTPVCPGAESQELGELLLEQIAEGGRLCREIESALGQNPSPELETIIKLIRVLVLKLSTQAQAEPERFGLVSELTRRVIEWGQLEERRKAREFSQEKHRDQLAQKTSRQHDAASSLSPETLEKIEHELNLF